MACSATPGSERASPAFKGKPARAASTTWELAVEHDLCRQGPRQLQIAASLQMCSHHLADPVACTPAFCGWEKKGQVETGSAWFAERSASLPVQVQDRTSRLNLAPGQDA